MRNDDVLLVDGQVVARLGSKLSTDARYLSGLFNGRRTLADVMTASVLPGPRTLTGLKELCKHEALLAVRAPVAPRPSNPTPPGGDRWGAETRQEIAMARTEPRPAATPMRASEFVGWERPQPPSPSRPATLGYHQSHTGRFRTSRG